LDFISSTKLRADINYDIKYRMGRGAAIFPDEKIVSTVRRHLGVDHFSSCATDRARKMGIRPQDATMARLKEKQGPGATD